MKIYSDNTVTRDDLVNLSAKHSSEFAKFKMTLLASLALNIGTIGAVVYLFLHRC